MQNFEIFLNILNYFLFNFHSSSIINIIHIYQKMPAFILSTHTAIIQYDINIILCNIYEQKKMPILPYQNTRHMRNADRDISRNQPDSHNLQNMFFEEK